MFSLKNKQKAENAMKYKNNKNINKKKIVIGITIFVILCLFFGEVDNEQETEFVNTKDKSVSLVESKNKNTETQSTSQSVKTTQYNIVGGMSNEISDIVEVRYYAKNGSVVEDTFYTAICYRLPIGSYLVESGNKYASGVGVYNFDKNKGYIEPDFDYTNTCAVMPNKTVEITIDNENEIIILSGNNSKDGYSSNSNLIFTKKL